MVVRVLAELVASGKKAAASRRNVMLNGFEILFALLLLPTSVLWVIAPESFAPVSVITSLHEMAVRVMGAMLLLGAGSVMAGILTVSPRIERAGLGLWAPTVGLYTFVVLTSEIPNSSLFQRSFGIGIFAAFTVACVFRYIILGDMLKSTRKQDRNGGS